MPWDPGFFQRSKMLEPFARRAAVLRECAHWPSRAALDALLRGAGVRNARGIPLHASVPAAAGGASYEARVHELGELEVREGEWHDLMNVLAWCVFPATKAAVNAAHVRAAQDESRSGNRGRERDALTLFDESGAIVVSSEPDLLEDVRAFRWKRLFWSRRKEVLAHLRVYLVGHGLLEKALAPYVGMTAHAITLSVERELIDGPTEQTLPRIDALAARHLHDAVRNPHDLAPLPLLGVPGWWPANEDEASYDDTRYFRAGRTRRR
jgi:hypothetical protein